LSLLTFLGGSAISAKLNIPLSTLHATALLIPFFSCAQSIAAYLRNTESQHLSPFFEVGGISLAIALSTIPANYFRAKDPAATSISIAALFIALSCLTALTRLNFFRALRRLKSGLLELRSNVRSLANYYSISLIQYAANWAGLLIISSNTDSYSTATFSVAQRVSMIIFIILNTLNGIKAPKYAGLFHAGEVKKIALIERSYRRRLALFSTPAAALIWLCNSEILALFHSSHPQGSSIIAILVIGQLANTLTGCSLPLLIATDKPDIYFRVSIIGGITGIVCMLALTPILGAIGAAIGQAAGISVPAILAMRTLRKELGI
jgi:O-antigen/teichoic acid export membrane protein